MIKKILKDVLGENFTENNEKYAKINFIIVILMFLVSAIMLFFLPEKINILHNGDTYFGNMACSCYFFGTEFYFYQAKKVIIIK